MGYSKKGISPTMVGIFFIAVIGMVLGSFYSMWLPKMYGEQTQETQEMADHMKKSAKAEMEVANYRYYRNGSELEIWVTNYGVRFSEGTEFGITIHTEGRNIKVSRNAGVGKSEYIQFNVTVPELTDAQGVVVTPLNYDVKAKAPVKNVKVVS